MNKHHVNDCERLQIAHETLQKSQRKFLEKSRQILKVICSGDLKSLVQIPFYREFDPGSGRTLAACLTHASRTDEESLLSELVANG